jgi:hypothetical protein
MPFFQGQCRVPGAGVLRKAKAMPSSKFFIWLALLDRCWTGDRLLRHHPKDYGSCPLCSQVEETIDHLLLGGCYTREVWHHLLVSRGLLRCCSVPQDRVAGWWHASRKKIARSVTTEPLVAQCSWPLSWNAGSGKKGVCGLRLAPPRRLD